MESLKLELSKDIVIASGSIIYMWASITLKDITRFVSQKLPYVMRTHREHPGLLVGQ